MINERRAILSLVAMGRITAADAERLMYSCQDAAEWAGITAACLVACLLPSHSQTALHGIGHLFQALAHGTRALHSVVSIGFTSSGGSL